MHQIFLMTRQKIDCDLYKLIHNKVKVTLKDAEGGNMQGRVSQYTNNTSSLWKIIKSLLLVVTLKVCEKINSMNI